MKKLQNNFTTPEQSKRLLELGVPVDSADFRQPKDNGLNGKEYIIFYNIFPFSKEIESTIFDGDNLLPCWSVGQLINIMALCYKFDFPDSGSIQIYTIDIKKGTVVDVLISDIERFINKIDFSKLED